jgi:hypothetical protein
MRCLPLVGAMLLADVPTGPHARYTALAERASVPASRVAVPLDLLALDRAMAGDAVPPGWAVRAVRGQRAPESAVMDSAGARFFRIGGEGRAAWYVRELPTPFAPARVALTWRWRVPVAPRGADLRREATDDAALRIFVVFARQSMFERTPRTLFYCTGGDEAAGYARASFASPRLHVIRASGADANAGWEMIAVDPFADYQRIWGEAPPAIVAVGIMQDTDQTRAATLADVQSLTWSPRHDATP